MNIMCICKHARTKFFSALLITPYVSILLPNAQHILHCVQVSKQR